MTTRAKATAAFILLTLLAAGCASSGGNSAATNASADANASAAKTTTTPPKPTEDGFIPSGTGTEKETPAAGKGNVQGRAFYNEKPAANVEVKLCQTFSRFLSGCGGETYTARTDANGEYLIKDVAPGVYEGLTVQVFDTPYYVFATSGFVNAAKYKIEEGKTYFAPDTNLFKQDLKLESPKAGSKIGASNIEVKWAEYPDAAYYKMSVHADTASGAKAEYDYIGRRIDGTSFTLDKPLTPGTYNVRVEAYNGNDIKLSQSSGDIKFTVTGDAAAK
ncbi:MAG TPA: carboxypeptidase-like regulatory domain-containing protein [Pyrinomonadaceae bacterium]|nr:carboxypeptidase-like regulatory domain-containing protein [Pyrinomonadaceae bacterium]